MLVISGKEWYNLAHKEKLCKTQKRKGICSMKKLSTRFLALALALTVAGTAAPVTANAQVTAPTKQTLYKTSDYSSSSINISCTKKSETIKKSSVKTSNPKVAKLRSLSRNVENRKYETDYFNKDWKGYTDKSDYYSYSIGLDLLKVGNATISFKVGSKTYKTQVSVKKYVNPLKSLTITGINGGKNLASKFKKTSYAKSAKLKKDLKNVTVKAVPAKGWKINSIYVYDNTDSESYSHSNYTKGVKNAFVKVDQIKAANYTNVNINLVDNTGATLYCSYSINSPY